MSKRFRRDGFIFGICGVLLLIFGGLVLSGWFLHIESLVRFHPSFYPMPPNGALCFLLMGSAFILLSYNVSLRAILLPTFPLIALSGLTLLEYLLKTDLGTVRIFVAPFFKVALFEGRIPPNSAVSFFLLACAILLWSQRSASGRLTGPAIIGSIVMALGGAALFGYTADLPAAYGWGSWSRMPGHAAIGFLISGGTFLIAALKQSRHTDNRTIDWAPVSACIGVLSVSLLLWYATHVRQTAVFQKETERIAETARIRIQTGLEYRVLALQRMKDRWERDRPSKENWESNAELYVRHHPGTRAVEWVDSDFRVNWIAPIKNNEKLQQFDLGSIDDRRNLLNTAMHSNSIVISDGIKLIQGPVGILVVVPLFHGGKSDGFLLSVLDAQETIADTLKGIDPGFQIRVMTPSLQLFKKSEYSQDSAFRLGTALGFRGKSWRLEVVAQQLFLEREQSYLPALVLSSGLLLTILVTLLVFLAQRSSQTARELKSQKQVLTSMLENLPVGVWMVDKSARLVHGNPEAQRIWRGSRYVGVEGYGEYKGWWASTGKKIEPEEWSAARAIRNQETSLNEIIEIECFDGSRKTISNSAIPILDESGRVQGAVVVNQDITERCHVEEERRKAHEELEWRVQERTAELRETNEKLRIETEKVREHARQLEIAVQELEAFSYTVSHDLRAPARAISGYVAVLTDEIGNNLEPEAGRCIDRIRANANKMGMLVDDLLAFSRLGRQELKRTRVNTTEVVQEIVEDLEFREPERKTEFKMNKLCECNADPVLLKQVFQNLLENAVKFSAHKEHPMVEVGCTPGDRGPVYYVRDNGVGFDMIYATKLFGVFERLHQEDQFEGTGVGLAIVKRIVERHNGSVHAKSTPEQGATFYFTFNGGNVHNEQCN